MTGLRIDPLGAADAGGWPAAAASHRDYPAFRVEFPDPGVRNRVLIPFQTAAAGMPPSTAALLARFWTITWPESRCGSRPAGFR